MNPQLSGLAALLLPSALALAAQAADVEPWKKQENAIVIDAYELNEIDWSEMLADKRIAGFISKASDGLPESYSCKGDHNGDTVAHCKTMWRKYAVSRELYETRRLLARSKGLLWGAYHLARPGNPVEQANHFLDYANPQDDEMMVLDIEGIDPDAYMSLEDAQVFAGHIKTRTGRYPVLYTNHSTARFIALNRDKYRILSRLPLWYARYKPGIQDAFPMGNWDNYALWQFSAGVNCSLGTRFNASSRRIFRPWMRLKLSVFWRVRLEYMMFLWRDSTSGMLRGSTPRALNRSTWNTREDRSSS